MKAELNLAFSYALLYRTDVTDKLRGKNIREKNETQLNFLLVNSSVLTGAVCLHRNQLRKAGKRSHVAWGIALIKQPQLASHKASLTHLIWDPA